MLCIYNDEHTDGQLRTGSVQTLKQFSGGLINNDPKKSTLAAASGDVCQEFQFSE